MKLRSEVFNVLLKTLSNFKYCFLRNYSTLPEYENDIDILIERGSSRALASRLITELNRESVVLLYSTQFSCLAVFLYDSVADQFIHVDLFEDIKWKVFEYLPSSDVLATRVMHNNFYVPSPFFEMHELLLTRLIYHGRIKEAYKERVKRLYDVLDERSLLIDKFDVYKSIAQSNWGEIERKVNSIRTRVIADNLIKPTLLIQNTILFVKRSVLRILKPPGLFIAFYGVDGSGKSTQIKNLSTELKGIFSDKVRIFHFRPTFVYRNPKDITISDPHNQRPPSFLRSMTKSFFYLFIYNWGYFTQVLPLIAENGLVIFDRYYYDLLVDSLRYRFSGQGFARILGFFIPSPHINICLMGDYDRILQRKKEIDSNEIEDQQRRLKEIHFGSNTCLVDASNDISQVAEEIKKVIIHYLIERND